MCHRRAIIIIIIIYCMKANSPFKDDKSNFIIRCTRSTSSRRENRRASKMKIYKRV